LAVGAKEQTVHGLGGGGCEVSGGKFSNLEKRSQRSAGVGREPIDFRMRQRTEGKREADW
jgi:hypothetical protein